MKEKVMAAVSLDSSEERVSGGLFSLTSAVDMVMVCGGASKKRRSASRYGSDNVVPFSPKV